MNLKQLFVAVPAALFIIGNGVAIAGQTVDVAGTIACVTDKRDEKEPDKGHKLVDAAMRCVVIPDDAALPKFVQSIHALTPDECPLLGAKRTVTNRCLPISI